MTYMSKVPLDRVAEAIQRARDGRAARKETRSAFAERRDAGLKARHRKKLSQAQPLLVIDTEAPLDPEQLRQWEKTFDAVLKGDQRST